MRTQLRTSALLLTLVLGTLAVRAQTLTPDERRYRPGPPDLRVNGVETLPVRGKVYLLATGRASNVVAQVGGFTLRTVRRLGLATILVLALAAFDGPEVEARLEAALTDRDWQVRQAAEDVLPRADES